MSPPALESRFVSNLLLDLRYGLRSFARNPGFAAAAVLTLALGIGANTAIFSVLHGVVLRPLQYGEPDHLVRFQARFPFSRQLRDGFAERTRTLEGISGYTSEAYTLVRQDRPRAVASFG